MARASKYGLIAEFDDPERLVEAVRRARSAGYEKMDAYSPFPIENLADEIGQRDDRVPWIVFICGVSGALFGLWLQWYITNVDLPLNVGGRPNFSWPSFVPVIFELGILSAAFGAVIGMLALNGLPRPHHPIFDAPGFERATDDRFFLCIEATDPKYDSRLTREFLESTHPDKISEVIES